LTFEIISQDYKATAVFTSTPCNYQEGVQPRLLKLRGRRKRSKAPRRLFPSLSVLLDSDKFWPSALAVRGCIRLLSLSDGFGDGVEWRRGRLAVLVAAVVCELTGLGDVGAELSVSCPCSCWVTVTTGMGEDAAATPLSASREF
jgi:hypothetical protein